MEAKIGIEEAKIETIEKIIDKGIIEAEMIEREAMREIKEAIEIRTGVTTKVERQMKDEITDIKETEVRIGIEMIKRQDERDTDKVIYNLCRHS